MRKQKDMVFDNMRGEELTLYQEFNEAYPILSELLGKAIVIDFRVEGNQSFRQYIWFYTNGRTAGWLCRMEHQRPQDLSYLPQHLLLSKNIGGIINY